MCNTEAFNSTSRKTLGSALNQEVDGASAWNTVNVTAKEGKSAERKSCGNKQHQREMDRQYNTSYLYW